MKVKVKCQNKECGKDFEACESLIRRGGGKHCSRECYKQDKRTGYWSICLNSECNKNFYIPKRETGKEYCSLKCKRSILNIRTQCNYCNKDLITVKNQVNHGRGKNCSYECAYRSRKTRKYRNFIFVHSNRFILNNKNIWRGIEIPLIFSTFLSVEFFTKIIIKNTRVINILESNPKRKCLVCEKETKNNRIYCSYECRGKDQRKGSWKICLNPKCNKEFYVKKQLENIKNKCCSIECASIIKKDGKIVNCFTCGKEVYRKKSEIRNRNFCNKECYTNKPPKIYPEYICLECGKKFSRRNLKNVKNKFCSRKCSNEHNINNCSVIKGPNKLELSGRDILLDLDINFREQVPMYNKWIVDILCVNKNVVIQWDGDYWHNLPQNKIRDKNQDKYLTKCGYRVLRFTETQVKKEKEYVKNKIRREYDATKANK